MNRRSPAQAYALAVGGALLAGGLIGFLYEPSFAVGDSVERDAVFGLLDVNGWHNVVHLSTGAAGLALMGSWGGARAYALGLGAVYLLVTAIGLAYGDGEAILGLIPINTADNVLHLAIGALGVIAALATAPHPAPTTQGAGGAHA
jgi:hypothetical protein